MDRLAIEFICAFGMHPADFARMAAELGVNHIGLAPSPITDNPHNYPAWDLRSDPALVRETKAALDKHGVSLSQGEGFLIMQGLDMADNEPLFDIMAELGAPMVNTVVVEQDRSRALDQFALYAEMAQQRGQIPLIEFMPMMQPGNLSQTLQFLEDSGAGNAQIMLDAMHFFRSGSMLRELANAPQSAIGYIQLCDAPLPAGDTAMTPEMMQAYGEEARHERMCPGDGDLPLADFLTALPRDLSVGLEIPMMSKAKAGISPVDAMRPCVKAARDLLGGLE